MMAYLVNNPCLSVIGLGMLLAGCTSTPDPAAVIDQLPKSACRPCTREPFYHNGHWLQPREKEAS